MNESLKISVIVPCYNQSQFLDQCIESLVEQSYKNWECIIINDGSTDLSENLALKWQTADSRIKYFRKENGGLSSARNYGLSHASGNYIQFLDCDDFLDQNKFSKSINKLQNTEEKVVITNFYRLNEKTKTVLPAECKLEINCFSLEAILKEWEKRFTIPIHCALFPSSLAKQHRFNEEMKAKEDWLYWMEIYSHNPKTTFIDEPLVCYRINPSGMTRDNSLMHQYQIAAFRKLEEVIKDNYLYVSFLKYNNEFFMKEHFRLTNKVMELKEKRKLRYILKKVIRILRLKQ